MDLTNKPLWNKWQWLKALVRVWALRVLVCWPFGHKWQRYGFASAESDVQLFVCHRCWWCIGVEHNGMLPRFKENQSWKNGKEAKADGNSKEDNTPNAGGTGCETTQP